MPKPIDPDIIAAAVIAPAHMRSMAKPGTVFGRPARIAAERPMVRPWSPVCVVAGDRDVVDAVLRHARIAFEQSDDRLHHEVVGPRVPVHALVTGSSERGTDPVDEHDFSSFSHAAAPYFRSGCLDPTKAIRGR
jgi:hypothetical protein